MFLYVRLLDGAQGCASATQRPDWTVEGGNQARKCPRGCLSYLLDLASAANCYSVGLGSSLEGSFRASFMPGTARQTEKKGLLCTASYVSAPIACASAFLSRFRSSLSWIVTCTCIDVVSTSAGRRWGEIAWSYLVMASPLLVLALRVVVCSSTIPCRYMAAALGKRALHGKLRSLVL